MIDTDCDWDEEAIEEAIRQAHDIEHFDPEAAKQLLAQAQAAKQKLQGSTSLQVSYDPMALYARVLRFYKGAITDERLEKMDYRRFFGYVRELELIAEEEQKAAKKPAHQAEEAYSALSEMPHAQAYQGEVVKLI